MQEIWKDVINYEGFYQVSNFGQIKSFHKNKEIIMKPFLNKGGYVYIMISDGVNLKNKRLHRLVAEAFHPNPENKRTVNHLDGNKQNNFAYNLEWNTHSENHLHSNNVLMNNKGGGLGRKINQLSKGGEFIKSWNSIREASNTLDLDAGHISACCMKNTNRKSCGGYIWEYD